MKKFKFRSVASIVLGVIALAGGYGLFRLSRTVWIPAGHVGIIFDASSGVQKDIIPARATYVGWRQQLFTYPTKLQAAIYTEDDKMGEVRAADGILVTTNDNASTLFDVVVCYRVREEDAIRAFNAFGAIRIEEIQSLHIRRAVKEAANVVSTQYDLFALMGPKRQEASEKITEELQKRLQSKGITVERAMLCGCYPSTELNQKITSRVNSYVELEISRLKQEIAEIDREIAVIKGEAENQASTLTAATSQDRSVEFLQMEAAAGAIEKWNGALPPVQARPGQTLVLGQDVLSALGGRK
ncbi:MAG: SPFH domain-containing protein [Fimbriimonas sp.]